MSTARNALILHHNIADEATVTASSQITDAEAAFVQEMEPGEPWRATGKVEEMITFDHGAEVDATHAAIIAHNLSVKGVVQHILTSDPAFAPSNDVFNTGEIEPWDPVAGFGYDGFGRSAGGYPILNERNDYRALKTISYGGRKTFRYSRFIFGDPENDLITGISLGRAFIGDGLQPQYNFDVNWSNDWADPSKVTDTQRTVRVKRGRPYRTLRLNFSYLTEQEAIIQMDDIKRVIAGSRDLICSPFPTAGAPKRYRTDTYGIPVDRQGTANPYLDVYKTSLFIRELAP